MRWQRVRTDSQPSWICCHLGAREHYATPRALHRHGRLAHLITDAWVPPSATFRFLPGARSRRLQERYHHELARLPVTDFTASLVTHEAWWRLQGQHDWALYQARNSWFQRKAARAIASAAPAAPIVFAHSYAALDVFRAAKSRGWRCVLGQIDPGAHHFTVVRESARQAPEYGPPPPSPPPQYLDRWREECALADAIVVNSEWSRRCLEEAGVDASKMTIVPLAYEGDDPAVPPHQYPDHFTADRPLRMLFVGHAAVAKGIKALLDALALAADTPVELTIVGDRSAQIPPADLTNPRIRWIGAVSRSAVMHYYRAADVLVFPSLSDGFGMAQIEAQGWRLPIVASHACGSVVREGINGTLLRDVTPSAIADVIRRLAASPELLATWSRQSVPASGQGLTALGAALVALEER